MFKINIPEIVRLNAYMDDSAFVQVMNEVEAHFIEGNTQFELDTDVLTDEQRLDLIAAFSALTYAVEQDHNGILYVS